MCYMYYNSRNFFRFFSNCTGVHAGDFFETEDHMKAILLFFLFVSPLTKTGMEYETLIIKVHDATNSLERVNQRPLENVKIFIGAKRSFLGSTDSLGELQVNIRFEGDERIPLKLYLPGYNENYPNINCKMIQIEKETGRKYIYLTMTHGN